MYVHRNILRSLLQVLFPPQPLHSITATSLAHAITHAYIRQGGLHILAPLPFEHEHVRACVHAAKFTANTHAATLLGAVLAPLLAEELADLRLMGRFENPLLTPIPLHHTRLTERGFNQSERIARALIPRLGNAPPQLAKHILIRTKHTHQQSHLSRTARQTNVRGAFTVHTQDSIAGKDIILLDDVVTTGATMREAEATLRNAGARDVLCVAAARS